MVDLQAPPDMAVIQAWLNSLDHRIQLVKPKKERFEGPDYCVIEFSAKFLKINEYLGSIITRHLIEFCWVLAVCDIYPMPEPHRTHLLYQVLAPLTPQ